MESVRDLPGSVNSILSGFLNYIHPNTREIAGKSCCYGLQLHGLLIEVIELIRPERSRRTFLQIRFDFAQREATFMKSQSVYL